MDRRNFSVAVAALVAGTQGIGARALAASVKPKSPSGLTVDGLAPVPTAAAAGAPDLGLNANLNGSRLFANSQWYRDVSGLAVHPKSPTYLATLSTQVYSQDAGGWVYKGSAVGIPYFVVDTSSQPYVPVVCAQYLNSCDIVYAPIPLRDDLIEGYPANANFPTLPGGETDRHLVVIDRRKRVIYELYKAYRRSDHWYCSNMAVWDMDAGDLQRPFNDTSVDVAGMSVMGGLILGHQVTGNTIDHAFRFTIQHQCPNYLSPPAAHASAFGNPNALPFGGRIRLKASVSETAKPGGGAWNANALRIVRALKKYGMINADTGLPLSPQGDTSPWDAASGTGGPAWQELRLLKTADFEVIDSGATQYSADGSTPIGVAPTATLVSSAREISLGQTATLTPSWTGKSLAWMAPVGNALKAPAPVVVSPARDAWYQLEVINPYGRVRKVERVIVTDGAHRYAHYDRYIGPAGSAANDGSTAASPWPISVLADGNFRHLIAGYVIGLLDGTYDLSGMNSADYDIPLLQIPTGTFGRPTVLQAVNRRRAVLAGGSSTRPVLGSRYQELSQIQMIGLMLNTPAAQYASFFSGDGAFLIDDCEFSGFQAAAICATAISAAFFRANTVHNTGSSSFMRLGKCADIHIRGTALDVPGREWEEYGGTNSRVVVD
jgi:hypothetical protein